MRWRWWLLTGGVGLAACAWFAMPSSVAARDGVAASSAAPPPTVESARPIASQARTEARPKSSAAETHEETPALASVRAAARDSSPAGTAKLEEALDADDEIARLEAIDALVERKRVAILPRLIELDPAAEPMLGHTIIAAMGALGGATRDGRSRDTALGRLVALLASEKERRGADSEGYIVEIVEALGQLRHPGGAPVLERELTDSSYDVAGRTGIVQALGRIGQRSSLAALDQLGAAMADAPYPEDDLARALDSELAQAIEDAKRAIAGR